MKSFCEKFNFFIIVFFTIQTSFGNFISKKDTITNTKRNLANIAPILIATGDQIYCPQTSINIVTDFTITDPDDTSIDVMYVQISSGYNPLQDIITLTGNHPTIATNWSASEAKLKLYSPIGIAVSYIDFISAIKDIIYTNTSLLPTGNRTFSITIGQANYLPQNGHYYKYVPTLGITWQNAKVQAESSTYYGLQGYLVTITSAEENQLVAEQALGTGWIAGSDEDLEGVWLWKSGPETGTNFFQNLVALWGGGYASDPLNPGYAPVYANWNRTGTTYEPNNLGGKENFAHITDPSIGNKGSWNDANFDAGPAGSPYESKGYVIEYGGMPNDPLLQIGTSTKITIPQITKTTTSFNCGPGTVAIQAESNLGIVNWYENEFGGNPVAVGITFTTPTIQATTTYYVETVLPLCANRSLRIPIIATIFNIPTIINTPSNYYKCGPGEVTITANVSEGNIFWYETATGNSLIGIGNSLTRILDANTTFYAQATNNTVCSNGVRVPVNIVIYPLPFVEDQNQILCKNSSVVLDSKYIGGTYLWSTGETTQTIEVTLAGNYTVQVTSPPPDNCINTNNLLVIEKTISEINYVDVNENTATIFLKNTSIGDFEYSIDGINFQLSNIFENVAGGTQTAYVREINSCGETNQKFYVLGVPTFFSPNNDSYNDVWKVVGFENYPKAEITIFDKFGKLITILNNQNPSWNGTFNNQNLPATDYWYVMKVDETKPLKKGHFSLIR
jgi:gliding motility-associated-like protein